MGMVVGIEGEMDVGMKEDGSMERDMDMKMHLWSTKMGGDCVRLPFSRHQPDTRLPLLPLLALTIMLQCCSLSARSGLMPASVSGLRV